MQAETKICVNCKKDFTIEPEDFSFYQKMGVPPPTWCPRCRFLRKMCFVNERSLYKRNCGKCGKPVVSMYAPESPFAIWCVKCHLGDDWDGRDYGREYDFSKNFFLQFRELKEKVPHRAMDQNERNGAGCEYANYCYTSKEVYLSFSVLRSENVKYSRFVFDSKNCLDSLILRNNDRGYELVKASQNYNSSFLIASDQCVESHFLFDCSNCVNCCLSSNLRNKSYVFKNRQLTREGYKDALAALRLNIFSGQTEAKEIFAEVYKSAVHRCANIKNSIDSSGDFVENSKSARRCYFVVNSENVQDIFLGGNVVKDSRDLVFPGKLEECYETVISGRGGNRVIFCFSCGRGSRNLFYCDNCKGCADCFGCVGLDKKQYCVLNKQYTKEDYEALVAKIKRHMEETPYIDVTGKKYGFGEYFPPAFSPFAYNESLAYEELRISEEEIKAFGSKWKDIDRKYYEPTLSAEEIPDSIEDISDNICEETIKCPGDGNTKTLCVSAFRILPDELSFYRQMNLPLPRKCPNCRYYDRLRWTNPFSFYQRECMCDLKNHGHADKCQNKFETMYAPERPEKIFCKECYQKEVY